MTSVEDLSKELGRKEDKIRRMSMKNGGKKKKMVARKQQGEGTGLPT